MDWCSTNNAVCSHQWNRGASTTSCNAMCKVSDSAQELQCGNAVVVHSACSCMSVHVRMPCTTSTTRYSESGLLSRQSHRFNTGACMRLPLEDQLPKGATVAIKVYICVVSAKLCTACGPQQHKMMTPDKQGAACMLLFCLQVCVTFKCGMRFAARLVLQALAAHWLTS